MKLSKALLFSLSLAIAGCQTIPNKAESLEAVIERPIETPIESPMINYPEVSIQNYGFEGLNEEELSDIVSRSVIKSGDYTIFNDIKSQLFSQIWEDTGRRASTYRGFFIFDPYIIREERGHNICVYRRRFTFEEIVNVMQEENLSFIRQEMHPNEEFPTADIVYITMEGEEREILEENLEEKYPNRDVQLEQEVEEEFERLLRYGQEQLANKVKGNNNFFINLRGYASANSRQDYEYYMKELDANQEELGNYFSNKGYTIFNVTQNTSRLTTILEEINKNSNTDTNLVVFYSGHGQEQGLQLENARYTYLTPNKFEENLKDYQGGVTLFLSNCYSGNFRQELEERQSDITVISASKPGEVLYGMPWLSFLAQDLIESDMDLSEFGKYFEAFPEANYFPRKYAPD